MADERGRHFDPRLFDHFWSLLPQMRAIADTETDDEVGPVATSLAPADFDWANLSGQTNAISPLSAPTAPSQPADSREVPATGQSLRL